MNYSKKAKLKLQKQKGWLGSSNLSQPYFINGF